MAGRTASTCSLTGMVRRSPELVLVCATVWCGLCLPFYMEPHYRDPCHVGDFIDIAADAAGPGQIEPLALMLLGAIEVASRAHERVGLLQRLRTAAGEHGFSSAEIDDAVARVDVRSAGTSTLVYAQQVRLGDHSRAA